MIVVNDRYFYKTSDLEDSKSNLGYRLLLTPWYWLGDGNMVIRKTRIVQAYSGSYIWHSPV